VGEAEIFDGSVLDNVRFGRANIDAKAIAEALHAVALSDEVGELSDGGLTALGHKGSRLTSSQAARLMIARALVSVPRLLIIDEALDGLGAETARKALAGLAQIRHQTSVLVFTSREEIASAVGGVLHLDQGVVEAASAAAGEVAR
jgi:ATP-binding cassette subfamily B protein